MYRLHETPQTTGDRAFERQLQLCSCQENEGTDRDDRESTTIKSWFIGTIFMCHDIPSLNGIIHAFECFWYPQQIQHTGTGHLKVPSTLLITILVALLVVLSIVLNIPLTVLGIHQLLISIHQFSFLEVYQEYCNSGGNSHEKDDNF
jgi:hypothetical protein